MSKKRAVILVDGSNFYFKLKNLDLHNLLNFRFSAFTEFLAKDLEVIKTIYYIGAVKTDGTTKTKKLHDNQQKLFEHLKKNKVKYSLGYLLKSDGRFHEKGVDVNIAVDILVATYENICDEILLVSSDTDLLPAVRKAKEKGKSIEYIGFSHQPSVAMVANCSKSRLLTKQDLSPFVVKRKKINELKSGEAQLATPTYQPIDFPFQFAFKLPETRKTRKILKRDFFVRIVHSKLPEKSLQQIIQKTSRIVILK